MDDPENVYPHLVRIDQSKQHKGPRAVDEYNSGMSEPTIPLGPRRWTRMTMMPPLLLLLLLVLAQLEPSLARRPAKEDEIADDLVEGASRVGGGFMMTERPIFMGTAWSVKSHLVGNAIRLNATYVIMHVTTAQDVFMNATVFYPVTQSGFNANARENQPEQLHFGDSLEVDPKLLGTARKFSIESGHDLAIGRTPFRLYKLVDSRMVMTRPVGVGNLNDFMETNGNEMGKDCSVYGWSDSPIVNGAREASPDLLKLVQVPIDGAKCNSKGRCEITTRDGELCRIGADRGLPIMCGEGEKKKLTYMIDKVEADKVGGCLKTGIIYAFHTAPIYNALTQNNLSHF